MDLILATTTFIKLLQIKVLPSPCPSSNQDNRQHEILLTLLPRINPRLLPSESDLASSISSKNHPPMDLILATTILIKLLQIKVLPSPCPSSNQNHRQEKSDLSSSLVSIPDCYPLNPISHHPSHQKITHR